MQMNCDIYIGSSLIHSGHRIRKQFGKRLHVEEDFGNDRANDESYFAASIQAIQRADNLENKKEVIGAV